MLRKIKDWLIVIASLADDAAVVVLILLLLWWLNIPITWPIIIFLVVIFLTSILIIHKLVIPALRRRKIMGSEGMIGLQGIVAEALNPSGLVKIKGEYWKARSLEGFIDIGRKITVVGFDGLTLQVKIMPTQ